MNVAKLAKRTPKWAMTASCCRDLFKFFVNEFWSEVPGAGTLLWSPHMDVLCEEMQTVAERVFANQAKLYDLIINISPGTSKSSICSILFHPWTWTRMPGARHINASHTDALVLDLANKARFVIDSDKYKRFFPEISLRADQNSKGDYANEQGGERKSCTVAGKSPTGRHAHFLIGDDLIDPKKAISEAELKTASDFVTQVLPSRKVRTAVDLAVTITIMQRLGLNDPTEVLLKTAQKEGATKIRHICLPAELSDDVRPKKLREIYVDGLMDPVRLPRAVLDDFRARLGEYGYAGQFMQSPIPMKGGMFKPHYFNQRCKAAPYHAEKRIRFWDRACLLGDSEIETSEGLKAIRDVQAGDYVLTRQGFKRVRWSGRTKQVDQLASVLFSNGSIVMGTEDHRIWTTTRGWSELASLTSSDYNLSYSYYLKERAWLDVGQQGNPILKQLCSMGSLIQDDQESDILEHGDMTRLQRSRGQIPCIEPSGDFITVISPLAMIFTTLTRTGTTTRLKILSASLGQSTIDAMMCSVRLTIARELKSIISESSNWHGKTLRTNLISANFVEKNSSLEDLICRPSFVVQNAEHDSGMETSLSSVRYASESFLGDPDRAYAQKSAQSSFGKGSARRAKKNLRSSSIRKNSAPCLAELNGDGCLIDVYDLEVEDAHEFFADGVLVHNSTDSGGCFSAGVLMSYAQGNYYLEHVEKGQWEPDERNQRMRATALRDRNRYGPNNDPVIYVEREGGSSGRDAWKGVARALVGFAVFEETVTGSKDTRAEPWAAQCAAGNVWIVEDGTWDIDSYIQEHCLFRPEPGKRLGRYKDQVDASTGAFNKMIGMPAATGQFNIRISGNGLNTKNYPRIIPCSKAELANMVLDDRAILFALQDPNDNDKPLHGLNKLLECVQLHFADIDPSEHQATWGDPVAPWNEPAEKLIMQPSDGKRMWKAITLKRDPSFHIIVIADNEDRRALSAAYAIADIWRLGRKKVIWMPRSSDNSSVDETAKAPNEHVYQTVKTTRNLVI